ncbi:MAG: hypothetical protein QM778_21240 [Myxococcales bacterium]
MAVSAPISARADQGPQSSASASSSEKAQEGQTDQEKKAEAKAKQERCDQLLAQGQTSVAQAEGCGGDDGPSWAGTIVSFSQAVAPLYRTLPYHNGYYALSLYLGPRLSINERWAINADVTLAYEVTPPDDASQRHKLWSSDTRLTAIGNLGSLGGFTFTGGPRLVVPTSEMSWAADVIAGTGATLSVVRSFDVLAGLALSLGGSYVHTWSQNLTREIREGDPTRCAGLPRDSVVDCTAGQYRVVQDAFRVISGFSLNMTTTLNLQLNYIYGWNLVKAFHDETPTIDITSGPTTVDEAGALPDNRIRRRGDFLLALSYQPATWLIATLQGTTSVCYDQAYGGQSALGGCAGGLATSDFWLRNPLVNKFSTLALQLTVPVDALVRSVRAH